MKRHPINIIIAIAVICAVAFIAGCGNDVKPLKYPGKEPVGEAKAEGEIAPSEPSIPDDQSTEDGSVPAMTPESKPGGGKSAITPVAPFGAEPVARPLQDDEEEVESSEDEEASSEETEEGIEEEAEETEETEEAEAEPTEEAAPERKKKPSYYEELGIFAFEYNDAGQGKVGEFNEMLAAIDILTVNEEKYEYAEAYLTEEVEGFSRGDPLFIPEAVPDELRPLIPGEGIQGALDQELLDLFRSQVQADLRSIPIWITGVMEQGGSKLAIGTIRGSLKFKVSQGQEIRLWYSGWYLLGITGTHISEDLVVLNLRLLQFTGRSFIPITDPVPRSFHIGIT